jgi:hypothetical protein
MEKWKRPMSDHCRPEWPANGISSGNSIDDHA